MTVPQPPFRVRTIYSWSGSEEDDLGFIEGDIIEVDGLGDGNWWHGRLKRNKLTGNFPSNYVELIKSDLQNMNSSLVSSSGSSPSTPVNNKRSSMGRSSVTQSGNLHSPYSRTQSPSHRNSSPAIAAFAASNGGGKFVNSASMQDLNRSAYSPEDMMQFSFQSSRSHYHNNPESPYRHQENHLPHSRSVPVRLEQEQGYTSSPSPSSPSSSGRRKTREESSPIYEHDVYNQYDYDRSTTTYRAPPPPQHSIPVRSQSRPNLKHYDSNRSQSPDRKPNLLKQAQQNHFRDSQSTDFALPYDPETLNQSKSSTSQSHSSNVFSYSNGSYFGGSLSSTNSSFAMSDFSATSAGSYARHKFEDQDQTQQNLRSSASGNQLLVEDKRVKNPTGILKKIFSTKGAPPLPSMEVLTRDVDDLSVQNKQMNQWLEIKMDLNRANSLSSKERQLRERRVRENEGYIIFEPHKQLSNINNNEVYQTEHKIDLHSINLNHVDNFVRRLNPQSTIMSPESFITNELGMKYSSKLEYLRALFILCTEHFTILESNSSEQVENPIVDELFHYKRGKSFDMAYLFKYLADLMGLKSELIYGSLKTPQSIVRHYWNSVLINGEWRFIDVSLGNISNPIHEVLANQPDSSNESFYFLAEPLDLIYTHIPDKYEEQHIVPPIDPMVALALPPCFPSFFKNGLKISKFSNALTRLKDFEIFEIDLKIPKDIEINASVMTKTSISNTLAQVYWKHNERYCKVKGLLPNNSSTGFVNIYSGPKGTQKSLQNIHSLSMTIPITHEGDFKPLEFLTRFPTVPAQSNDLYVKQPQNKNLSYGAEYIFNILQYPSNGLNSMNSRSKIALQSPSGKITKFIKKDLTTPSGTWELPMKCNEVGVWRGLVSIDNATSLCVFAEWCCN